jgi:hypothetical protein
VTVVTGAFAGSSAHGRQYFCDVTPEASAYQEEIFADEFAEEPGPAELADKTPLRLAQVEGLDLLGFRSWFPPPSQQLPAWLSS